MCCQHVLAAGHPLPASAREHAAHLDLLPVRRAVRLARGFVASQLAGEADREVLDAALLLASELVTNAVLHARTPLQLSLTASDDLILIAVGDGNQARPQQQPHALYDPGGRGLVIVDRFSACWGTKPSELGKTVWCALCRTSRERDEQWLTPA